MAADMPVKAPPPRVAVFDWTGFYVGLNAGGVWARSDVTTVPSCAPAPPGFLGYFCGPGFGQTDANTLAAAGSGSMSEGAFTGGGQIGFNSQIGGTVLGIELDFNSFNIQAARQASGTFVGGLFPPGYSFTISSSVDTNWLFTARGRVGWAFDNLLAYLTGGLAATDLHATHSFRDSFVIPGAGTWSGSETKLGWTIGGGFEWAFTRNWSVKAEYLYLDFGSVDAAGMIVNPVGGLGNPSGYANGISTSADLTAHIARAGVNFRF
jgi:outer membrane immunogenic protein